MSQVLTESLDLAQAPVAVCFREEVPAGVPAHEGPVPAGCRFWQQAAAGPFATSAPDHALCAIGVYTHNLEMSGGLERDLTTALKVFADLGYVRPEDVPQIPVLSSRPRHVVYAPLANSPADPDVVLLFVAPSEILILSEAAQQVEGGLPPAMGRPACAIVPQAVNTAKAALSLGCCGARAYLDVFTSDVALFALPGKGLPAYVERIDQLAKANRTLTRFHELRRKRVEGGDHPTVEESLAELMAG